MNIIFEDKNGIKTELTGGGGNEVHLYQHNVSFLADVSGYDIGVYLAILSDSSTPITTWSSIADYIINKCNGQINCCGNASGYTAIWFRCAKRTSSSYSVYVLSSSSMSSGDQAYLRVHSDTFFKSSDCTDIEDVVVQIL